MSYYWHMVHFTKRLHRNRWQILIKTLYAQIRYNSPSTHVFLNLFLLLHLQYVCTRVCKFYRSPLLSLCQLSPGKRSRSISKISGTLIRSYNSTRRHLSTNRRRFMTTLAFVVLRYALAPSAASTAALLWPAHHIKLLRWAVCYAAMMSRGGTCQNSANDEIPRTVWYDQTGTPNWADKPWIDRYSRVSQKPL